MPVVGSLICIIKVISLLMSICDVDVQKRVLFPLEMFRSGFSGVQKSLVKGQDL